MKNPTVDTSFLPDRDREEAEARERNALRIAWLAEQEKIKAETVSITYSYWDGSGHRKAVECKKGDSVAVFLERVRQQWSELRGTNVDNMMFIKEDLIIPQVGFELLSALVAAMELIIDSKPTALHILRFHPKQNPRQVRAPLLL
jgi:hypothetical protein